LLLRNFCPTFRTFQYFQQARATQAPTLIGCLWFLKSFRYAPPPTQGLRSKRKGAILALPGWVCQLPGLNIEHSGACIKHLGCHSSARPD
jgi:hypothetical protein